MSTTSLQPTPHAQASTTNTPSSLSFRMLVERLSSLRQSPPLAQLDEWLRAVEIEHEDLRPYVSFKSGTYARHRVMMNEFVEMLVLCWRPGQRTPIHDHNGSYGAVRVCSGVLWETMFTLDDERGLTYHSAREWRPGYVTGAAVPDIHQLGNPDVSGQDLVSLHVYAPPLATINTYRLGSAQAINTLAMHSWNPTI